MDDYATAGGIRSTVSIRAASQVKLAKMTEVGASQPVFDNRLGK